MGHISLSEVIVMAAQRQLFLQNEDGGVPPGTNGPWKDIDTPVRNTAHWALIYYKAYTISKENRFLEASLSACNYLTSNKSRPNKVSFYCLLTKNRPPENGLIGQAWAVEPLIFIGQDLKIQGYLETAREILLKHWYEPKLHLWRILHIDGKIGTVCQTFNQQLWFATMNLILGKITNDESILMHSRDFFKNLKRNIRFLKKGLIRHRIPEHLVSDVRSFTSFNIKKIFNKKNIKEKYTAEILRERSVGYLPFNLYALSLAYSNAPEEEWWGNSWYRKIILEIIQCIQSNRFIEESYKNPYAWRYNPFGFEIAYSLNAFRNFLNIPLSFDVLSFWVSRQLEMHWDSSSGLMNKNTTDPITLSARLYEATRLPNVGLNFNSSLGVDNVQLVKHK
ncbi:MAG: hypothetical protein AB1472_00030 [Candidatus Omnitrophota bacterium]